MTNLSAAQFYGALLVDDKVLMTNLGAALFY
jgi:hypothetical protein